jgi:REP element-mobilizing transposase RayT
MNELKGWHSRGYLPHYDGGNLYQFITFRLFDSVPKDVIFKWKSELEITEKTKRNSREYIELHNRILKFEDKGYGNCFLKNDKIRIVVEDALKFFNKKRYDLVEWVIMPNHVHVLIYVYENVSLTKIIHSWKSYTANEANRILHRCGIFWMHDYYDRYIRDDNHFQATVNYIRENGKL